MNNKLIVGAVAGVIGLILGACSINIVDDGTVEQGMFMGKVHPQPLYPGAHLVNPLASYSTWSTRDIKLDFPGVRVPSQDKFTTSVDITVMLNFDPTKAPLNRINGGATQEEAIDKYVTTKLMNTVREFGKAVPTAQDLFKSDVQSHLQRAIMDEVNEYSRQYGYTINQVMLQGIELDEVIKRQITNTKMREEGINQAKADRRRDNEIAQKKVDAAKADRIVAEQRAIADERDAQARNYAAKQDADAKLYAAQKEAAANIALQRTITPEMIKWRQLEVEMVRAQKYDGGVPQTVVGGDYKGGLLMDIRPTQQ